MNWLGLTSHQISINVRIDQELEDLAAGRGGGGEGGGMPSCSNDFNSSKTKLVVVKLQ